MSENTLYDKVGNVMNVICLVMNSTFDLWLRFCFDSRSGVYFRHFT